MTLIVSMIASICAGIIIEFIIIPVVQRLTKKH